MKKVVIVLLCFGLLMSLAIAAASAQEQITLRFMSGYTPTQTIVYPIVTKLIVEYERLNPHIKILELGAEANGDALLLKTLSSEPPDIIKTDLTVLTNFNRLGLLETMPDQLAQTMQRLYYPVAVQSLQFDGKLKGIPLGGNVTGIIYNKRLFAESGVGSPPATWAELDEVGPKLARWDSGGMVRPAIGVADSWFTELVLMTTVFGEGGRLIDDQGKVHINTPEVYAAFNLWINALTVANHTILGQGSGRFQTGFLSGQVPMWWGEPYFAQTLQVRGSYDDMAATAPLKGSVTRAATYRNHGYAVPTSAKNKEEAWKFLEWLAAADVDGGTPVGQIDAANASIPMTRKDITAPFCSHLMSVFENVLME
jgi:multiple sugar transport system substrate-binding protein